MGQSGRYAVEECTKVVELRREVEEDELEAQREKKKGMWGRAGEKGERVDSFFCTIYEILTDTISFVNYSPIEFLSK